MFISNSLRAKATGRKMSGDEDHSDNPIGGRDSRGGVFETRGSVAGSLGEWQFCWDRVSQSERAGGTEALGWVRTQSTGSRKKADLTVIAGSILRSKVVGCFKTEKWHQ